MNNLQLDASKLCELTCHAACNMGQLLLGISGMDGIKLLAQQKRK